MLEIPKHLAPEPLVGVVMEMLLDRARSVLGPGDKFDGGFVATMLLKTSGDYFAAQNVVGNPDVAKFNAGYKAFVDRTMSVGKSFMFDRLTCNLLGMALVEPVQDMLAAKGVPFSGAVLYALRHNHRLFLRDFKEEDTALMGKDRTPLPETIAHELRKGRVHSIAAALWLVLMDLVDEFVFCMTIATTLKSLEEMVNNLLAQASLKRLMPCVYRSVPADVLAFIVGTERTGPLQEALVRRHLSEAVVLYSQPKHFGSEVERNFLETVTAGQWFSTQTALEAVSARLVEDSTMVTDVLQHLQSITPGGSTALLDHQLDKWTGYFQKATGQPPTGPWTIEHYVPQLELEHLHRRYQQPTATSQPQIPEALRTKHTASRRTRADERPEEPPEPSRPVQMLSAPTPPRTRATFSPAAPPSAPPPPTPHPFAPQEAAKEATEEATDGEWQTVTRRRKTKPAASKGKQSSKKKRRR